MKCSSCGSAVADGASACQACGAPVSASAAAPSLPSTQVGGRPSGVSQRNLKPLSNREEKVITPVRVGDVLVGRYRLDQKIGEGGMGTVYVAHDQDLDRQVAVKLLAASLVTDDEVVERFEREAKLNAKLDHANIAPVFDVGRHEGRPFIVMKLLEGDTLAAVLRSKGGFSSDETLKLMRQLAAGLDYIHGRGFIHRDIKAGNIFIGSTGHATILDFGILRPKSASQGLTRTGMVMGTPHYMAPEQALGLRDVDHRVDLYALAVVLFECLTGTLPFEADSELRLIQMQAHAPPPDILQRAPWIVKPVADVMRRALAKRPDDRFASGAELVKALEAAYRDSGGHPAAPPQKLQEGTAPGWRMKAGLLSSLREKDAGMRGSAPALASPVGAVPAAPSAPPKATWHADAGQAGGAPGQPSASAHEAGAPGHAGGAPGHAGGPAHPAKALGQPSAPAPGQSAGGTTDAPGAGQTEKAPDAAPPSTSPVEGRTGRRGLVAAGVVATLGLLAAFATWKLLPTSGNGGGPLLAAADAGRPAPDAGSAVALATPDASTEAAQPDAGQAVALVTVDAGAPPPEDAGTRVAVVPAGKKSGKLNVITTHGGEPWWAQVSIDGVPRGRTPILLDLPVGRYQLRVERAGFRTEQREIKVASGKSTVLRIDLVP